jgi:quinol monooxygenase YgiN
MISGMNMYGVIGKMTTVEGKRDVFLEILLQGVNDMPGCLSYVVAIDPADPNGIWITEVWDSEASHKASLTLPSVKEAIAKGRPLIAGFSNRVVTTPVGGQGLPARKAIVADDGARHFSTDELMQSLDAICGAPKGVGTLDLIVRRPHIGQREILSEGELDLVVGLRGDNWSTRGSSKTADKSAHPEMQINIMGSRAIAVIAGNDARWSLAGDQLFCDLDLSKANLPPGSRLAIGGAVLEVTSLPHTGCGKFVARFGVDAQKFVNSPVGHELNLRGINARVV